MRSPKLPIAFISAIVFAVAGTLRAEISAVTVRVEQTIKSDMNQKDRTTRTHSRTLNVFVSNNSSELLDLKVKYIVFGRDMLNHDLITAGEGENPVSVKPRETEKVETAETKVTAAEAHYDAKTKKKTEASGASLVGFGVQILQGTTLMAEYYDPPSLKEEWGKTTPLAAPGAKPAAAAPAAKPAATPAATPAKK
jgi:hypothetical protein